MNYNLINFCEFDKYAVKSYCAIHNVDESLNLGDITKIDIESLPVGVDLITHGSPCFTADTLVLTDNGYKPIVEVKVGDMVLDHKLGYSMVTNFFEQGEKEIWEIEADFIKRPIRTTSNHRFYVKTSDSAKPRWIECSKLKLAYKLALVNNSKIKWIPINSITNTHKFEEVYDIEVENTHSFTANGVIAHNCQSFSVAGKQHGGEKGSGTRSSLLWNSVEVVRHCKPKFVIWENVKNVLSKKHKSVFDAYVDEMKNMGYNTYYQVLNAKNYGIPQNRERIYAISVREDIDNNPNYTGHIDHNKYYDKFDKSLFPKPFDNGLRLRDFLEDKVEEKYYLKDEYVERFKKSQESDKYPFGNKYNVLGTTVGTGRGTNSRHWVYDVNDNISTLDATMYKQPKQILEHTNIKGNEQVHRNHLLLTFDTIEGVNKQPKVLVQENTKKGYAEAYEGDSINLEQPNSTTRRGRVGKQCAQILTTSPQQATLQNMRIRRLTPKECYRLMGFSDEDFEKAKAVNSNTQLYKQAGNSIVVNVLEGIYKCLHNAYPNDFTKGMNVMSLFSGIGAFEKGLEKVDFSN